MYRFIATQSSRFLFGLTKERCHCTGFIPIKEVIFVLLFWLYTEVVSFVQVA